MVCGWQTRRGLPDALLVQPGGAGLRAAGGGARRRSTAWEGKLLRVSSEQRTGRRRRRMKGGESRQGEIAGGKNTPSPCGREPGGQGAGVRGRGHRRWTSGPGSPLPPVRSLNGRRCYQLRHSANSNPVSSPPLAIAALARQRSRVALQRRHCPSRPARSRWRPAVRRAWNSARFRPPRRRWPSVKPPASVSAAAVCCTRCCSTCRSCRQPERASRGAALAGPPRPRPARRHGRHADRRGGAGDPGRIPTWRRHSDPAAAPRCR